MLDDLDWAITCCERRIAWCRRYYAFCGYYGRSPESMRWRAGFWEHANEWQHLRDALDTLDGRVYRAYLEALDAEVSLVEQAA